MFFLLALKLYSRVFCNINNDDLSKYFIHIVFQTWHQRNSSKIYVVTRVEWGHFFINQNRSNNQRSGIILEVEIQNLVMHAPRAHALVSKFSLSKKSRGPKY